jgi:hypothetical protein
LIAFDLISHRRRVSAAKSARGKTARDESWSASSTSRSRLRF